MVAEVGLLHGDRRHGDGSEIITWWLKWDCYMVTEVRLLHGGRSEITCWQLGLLHGGIATWW